jgi:hypothetical protein
MKIKSGHLILTISWTAMGSFCFWCDPCFLPASGKEIMLMSGIWVFVTVLAGVIYGVQQTVDREGGEVLLDLSPKPKLTASQEQGNLSQAIQTIKENQ